MAHALLPARCHSAHARGCLGCALVLLRLNAALRMRGEGCSIRRMRCSGPLPQCACAEVLGLCARDAAPECGTAHAQHAGDQAAEVLKRRWVIKWGHAALKRAMSSIWEGLVSPIETPSAL